MRVVLAFVFSAIAMSSAHADRVTASVIVVGGPHAGSYYVRSADVPCEITTQDPPSPKHLFDVMIGGTAPSSDSTKLTILSITIPDADMKGEHHAFYAAMTFGDVGRGTHYVVESRPDHTASGSGIATLTTRGHDATVMFEASPTNGVEFRGTILCTDVSRY